MSSAYLYLNAGLYAVFALWCTIAPQRTSQNLGYSLLTPGGQSEYLVIYGGLQLGLAIMFFYLARNSQLERLGMLFAVALYAPIVCYRLVTLGIHWPAAPLTLATAALEAVLLLIALGLVWAHR